MKKKYICLASLIVLSSTFWTNINNYLVTEGNSVNIKKTKGINRKNNINLYKNLYKTKDSLTQDPESTTSNRVALLVNADLDGHYSFGLKYRSDVSTDKNGYRYTNFNENESNYALNGDPRSGDNELRQGFNIDDIGAITCSINSNESSKPNIGLVNSENTSQNINNYISSKYFQYANAIDQNGNKIYSGIYFSIDATTNGTNDPIITLSIHYDINNNGVKKASNSIQIAHYPITQSNLISTVTISSIVGLGLVALSIITLLATLSFSFYKFRMRTNDSILEGNTRNIETEMREFSNFSDSEEFDGGILSKPTNHNFELQTGDYYDSIVKQGSIHSNDSSSPLPKRSSDFNDSISNIAVKRLNLQSGSSSSLHISNSEESSDEILSDKPIDNNFRLKESDCYGFVVEPGSTQDEYFHWPLNSNDDLVVVSSLGRSNVESNTALDTPNTSLTKYNQSLPSNSHNQVDVTPPKLFLRPMDDELLHQNSHIFSFPYEDENPSEPNNVMDIVYENSKLRTNRPSNSEVSVDVIPPKLFLRPMDDDLLHQNSHIFSSPCEDENPSELDITSETLYYHNFDKHQSQIDSPPTHKSSVNLEKGTSKNIWGGTDNNTFWKYEEQVTKQDDKSTSETDFVVSFNETAAMPELVVIEDSRIPFGEKAIKNESNTEIGLATNNNDKTSKNFWGVHISENAPLKSTSAKEEKSDFVNSFIQRDGEKLSTESPKTRIRSFMSYFQKKFS